MSSSHIHCMENDTKLFIVPLNSKLIDSSCLTTIFSLKSDDKAAPKL